MAHGLMEINAMSRFEAPKQLLEYTLNKYSEYIDNVDIDELIS